MEEQYSVYFANLADKGNPWRHDTGMLAEVIMDLYYERTGPLAGGKNGSNLNDSEVEY